MEYDGTAHGGSQHQTNAPMVQGALGSALSSLTGEQIRVALAGRTDAGVHASDRLPYFITASRALDSRHPEGYKRRTSA